MVPPTVGACASSTPPTGTWAGRSTVRGCSPHQAAFVDHLIEMVDAERVDLVVVAGDVYDRALPPVDAVAPRRRGPRPARRLARPGGAHQRQPRLRPAAGLQLPADRRGRRVHLRTDAAAVGTPVLLEDEHGPVAVYGIPYLDPDAGRASPGAWPGAPTRRP